MMSLDDNRTQPEFSPGERLARLEAEIVGLGDERDELQKQMDRRFAQEAALFDEKLDGLRREVEAKNSAQKESVAKSELSTDRRLEVIGIQMQTDREELTKRVAALERGDSSSKTEKEAIVSLQNRQIALVGSLAIVVTAIIALISSHPFG